MITTDDIKALMSLAILNNKNGVISAMNSSGHSVPVTISDDNLFLELQKVFYSEGLAGLKNILSKVRIDTSKNTELIEVSYRRLNEIPPTAKGKLWQDVKNFFGDLFGGSSTITQPPVINTQNITPAISSKVIVIMAVFGIIAIITLIIIFRK